MYQSKGSRSSVWFHFIINGDSWSQFKQVAGIVRGSSPLREPLAPIASLRSGSVSCTRRRPMTRPHLCYASHAPSDMMVEFKDVEARVLDLKGVIVGPGPVGDVRAAKLMAEQHQGNRCGPCQKLTHQRKFQSVGFGNASALQEIRRPKKAKRTRDIISSLPAYQSLV